LIACCGAHELAPIDRAASTPGIAQIAERRL
jgi:hypothetical protein